jgi:PII-like signaling protein
MAITIVPGGARVSVPAHERALPIHTNFRRDSRENFQMPQGSQITVFASRNERKGHQQVADWILKIASNLGIRGATIIDASEGVDSHGGMHAARFLELTDQPVAVVIVAEDERITALLAELGKGGVRLFYTRMPIEFGFLGESQLETTNEL